MYGWFLGAYKVSVAVGVAGYFLLVLDMFGVGLLLARYVEPGLSLMLLWYGLYFGILGRDLAEVASEQMVRSGLGVGWRLQLVHTYTCLLVVYQLCLTNKAVWLGCWRVWCQPL